MDYEDRLGSPEGPRRVHPEVVELIDPRQPQQPYVAPPRPPKLRSRKKLALVLFVATCLSTFVAGHMMFRNDGLGTDTYWDGLSYSVPLMLILIAHEMGHYLQAKRYGVPASLPYFIPFPFISPFGTMGAVIVQGAGVADRKSLFDIAITGPLAGLVLAIPIAYIGVEQSQYAPIPGGVGLRFGDPLVLKWMYVARHGPIPEGYDVVLNPLLFAGWVGILVTALNLIPIGQLDGGHMLYTLIGKRAHMVATGLLWGAIGYMVYTHYYAYSLIVLLLLLMGPRHPPTADDSVPLGIGRIVLGWLTLGFIVIGFTPAPLTMSEPAPRRPSPQRVETDPNLVSTSVGVDLLARSSSHRTPERASSGTHRQTSNSVCSDGSATGGNQLRFSLSADSSQPAIPLRDIVPHTGWNST